MRQTAIRRSRNQNTKRSLRAEIKVLTTAIEAKDVKTATESLKKVQSNLDKAVKKNLIKKNTAARKLSRLTEQIKAIGAKTAPAAKKAPAKTVAAKPAAKKSAPKAAPKKTPAKKPATKK